MRGKAVKYVQLVRPTIYWQLGIPLATYQCHHFHGFVLISNYVDLLLLHF